MRALTIAFSVIALSLAAVGCDDGGSGSADTKSDTSSASANNCNSNSDCGSGQVCSGGAAKADGFDCKGECAQACATPGAPADCASACDAACVQACVNDCDFDCSDAADPAACVSACTSACGGGGGVVVTPPGGADATNGNSFSGKCVASTVKPPVDVTWAGTWTMKATYTAKCKSFSNNQSKTYTDEIFIIKLSGANGDLKAESGQGTALEMTGAGNNTMLNLTGPFAMKDARGETAEFLQRKDNNTTISVTSVTDANNASGTLKSTWRAPAAWDCTVEGGTFTLAR
ncbi:MAG: hypothetical protein R3F39_03045 [Myxococcota bacterium]